MVEEKHEKIRENVVEKILGNYGLFCSHIPYCFSTISLATNVNDIKEQLMSLSVAPIVFPLTFTMNKNALLRRTMGVPNILAYLKILYFVEENWSSLTKRSFSRHSESPINVMLPKHYLKNLRKTINARNNKFVGYKIKLNADISNCYDSIYTHSITWALLGKEKAKSIFAGKSVDDSEEQYYDIGNKFDELMYSLNGKQTNGIITGPYISVIFAEIILAEVDRLLKKEKLNFTRYVDDYNFYFTEESEVQRGLEKIASVLKEYNFTLNQSKLKKEYYPYDIANDYSKIFKPYIEEGQIGEVIYKALDLYRNGDEGAIVYLLKMLENKDIKGNFNIELILNLLLNIVINIPKVSALGIKILEDNMNDTFISKYKKILNKLLSSELNNEHYHESMWLLYIMGKKCVDIELENLKLILDSQNDMLIIMGLDYIENNFDKIYSRKKNFECTKRNIYSYLNESFVLVSNIIKEEDFTGQHWLLAYEVAYHNLRAENNIKIYRTKTRMFYKILSEKQISFYKLF